MPRKTDLQPNISIYPEFDFTSDSAGYYDGMWEKHIYGSSKVDPDKKSKTMQLYQRQLYFKELPDGTMLDLKLGDERKLDWKGRSFSSDSIIASFRYSRYGVMKTISKRDGWKSSVEAFLHKAYTIGGEMLFPVDHSINVARGFNNKSVTDRWDLTLKCIQSYYDRVTHLDDNGLNMVLQSVRSNSWFYDRFIDFKGFVKFFYLDPCVENGDAACWLDYLGLPKNEADYDLYQAEQMSFLEKRNALIREDCRKRGILKT